MQSQHFKKFASEIAKQNYEFSVDEDNNIASCDPEHCSRCIFKPKTKCAAQRLQWLYAFEPIKLSQLEYELLSFIENQRGLHYLVRDADGYLCAYECPPTKLKRDWDYAQSDKSSLPMSQTLGYFLSDKRLFKFCNWQDSEPCYIPNILKYHKIVK